MEGRRGTEGQSNSELEWRSGVEGGVNNSNVCRT